jgi:hypothetical protein
VEAAVCFAGPHAASAAKQTARIVIRTCLIPFCAGLIAPAVCFPRPRPRRPSGRLRRRYE